MRNQRRQHGVTIVMVALFIAVLLIFAALAVDVGVLYTARTSAQHIADASALAGAYTFLNATNTDPGAAAEAAANAMASGKQVFQRPITVTSVATVSSTGPSRIVVTVKASAPVFFARLIRGGDVPIETTATAEASNQAASTACLRPFWIANSQNDCTNPIIRSDGTLNTAWIGQPIEWHGNPTGGGQGGGTGGTGVPSQWGLIDPKQYGLDFQDMITSCSTLVSCGQNVEYKTGDVQAINSTGHPYVSDMIGQTPGGSCTSTGIPQNGQQDRWVAPFQYRPYSSTSPPYFDTSKSVVTVAVWDDCNNPPPVPGAAAGTFKVSGYVQMFIDCAGDSSQKTIWGHLVGGGSCGGGNGGGTATGPGAVPIRLIQPVQQ